MTYSTLAEVVAANDQAGRHWFEADSMEFFNSRLETDLIGGSYFVSSEQYQSGYPRLYTIRQADEDGHIHSIGEFQAYDTLDSAIEAIAKLGGGS